MQSLPNLSTFDASLPIATHSDIDIEELNKTVKYIFKNLLSAKAKGTRPKRPLNPFFLFKACVKKPSPRESLRPRWEALNNEERQLCVRKSELIRSKFKELFPFYYSKSKQGDKRELDHDTSKAMDGPAFRTPSSVIPSGSADYSIDGLPTISDPIDSTFSYRYAPPPNCTSTNLIPTYREQDSHSARTLGSSHVASSYFDRSAWYDNVQQQTIESFGSHFPPMNLPFPIPHIPSIESNVHLGPGPLYGAPPYISTTETNPFEPLASLESCFAFAKANLNTNISYVPSHASPVEEHSDWSFPWDLPSSSVPSQSQQLSEFPETSNLFSPAYPGYTLPRNMTASMPCDSFPPAVNLSHIDDMVQDPLSLNTFYASNNFQMFDDGSYF